MDGTINPILCQITVKEEASFFFEKISKISGTHLILCAKILNGDIFRIVLVNIAKGGLGDRTQLFDIITI